MESSKKYVPLLFLALFSMVILLTACSGENNNTASFGDGDVALSVQLVNGSYTVTNLAREDADIRVSNSVFVRGRLNLKICNTGQKVLPFVVTKDEAGILIEFQPEDVAQTNPAYLDILSRQKITSDEGQISLVPGTCPTYSFSFDSGGLGTGNSSKIDNQAFANAKYYFYIGDKKFPLTGMSDIRTKEEIQQASGISKEEAITILTTVSEKAPLDDCPNDGINSIPCLYAAWELAFKQYVPPGKEGVCDYVTRPEIVALCKSGLKKNLSDLQSSFDELKGSGIGTSR